MVELASVRVKVYGRVQGVFFRDFTSKRAGGLGLTGYVRNLPGGEAVEVQAEGEKSKLEVLIDYLRVGPPAAEVKKVETHWLEYKGSYSSFRVWY